MTYETREILTALSKTDLAKVFIDAMTALNEKGAQLPNKRRPRLRRFLMVKAEIDRRHRLA